MKIPSTCPKKKKIKGRGRSNASVKSRQKSSL
jgi:hypothetical protein